MVSFGVRNSGGGVAVPDRSGVRAKLFYAARKAKYDDAYRRQEDYGGVGGSKAQNREETSGTTHRDRLTRLNSDTPLTSANASRKPEPSGAASWHG